MTDEQLYAHAKQQEPQVQSVLRNLANAMLELDMVHEDGRCTAAYIDYDEQDMLNAATIMYSVCGNYAIKHGLLNEYNTEEKINAFPRNAERHFRSRHHSGGPRVNLVITNQKQLQWN